MCLSSELLNMKYWPEYDTYVGVGYKNLPSHYSLFDVWQEAIGWGHMKPNKKTGISKDGDYHAGFHIFLKKEDARDYNLTDFNNEYSQVYEVDYTDVVGFGKQQVTSGVRDCVIARWMWVHSEPVMVYEKPKPKPTKSYYYNSYGQLCKEASF